MVLTLDTLYYYTVFSQKKLFIIQNEYVVFYLSYASHVKIGANLIDGV